MTMEAVLRCEGLSKVFGEDAARVVAVDNVTVTIDPGEVNLIMGPSGSGKTTLLSMCGALMRPTAGSIWVAGREIATLSDSERSELRLHTVGFVFQGFHLLANLTAVENVRIVMEAAGRSRGEADKRARELLGELRMGHRVDAVPDKLSGGEKQRVAIARALANEPLIVLADEPTASLDSKTGYQVMNMLERVAKEHDKTVVAVSHDHRIQDIADSVLWLEDGHLSEHSPEEGRLARDPVCGKTINELRAAAQMNWEDDSFAFCSEICRDRFEEDPTLYATGPGAGAPGPEERP